jgi:arylsulfatase A-like enzyme
MNLRIVFALFAGLLASCAFAAQAAAPNKPNVILVLVDDQGYADLSCHGNPVLKTPNLDRLHSESIRLTDFHVAPMCTPTRGQLLTGLDALRNGAMNVSSGRTPLRQGIPTMADIFAAGGYQTAIFGKWHLGDNYPYRPQDRGFKESIWFPSSHIPSAADYWNNDYFDDTYWHNGVRKPFKGYCTDVFFDEAMRWMKECAARKNPFFTYLPLNAAHGPLFVPDKYRHIYKDQPRNVASFFGMIANIDENMGKLETFLRDSGLRADTILIFMTDNGGTAGLKVHNAGMKGGKITLWEGGHRVPFFLRWPAGKLRAPGDISELTHAQDVLPTLIDLCALQKPESARFDGLDLAKLLQGKQDALPDRTLVINYSRMDAPVPTKDGAAVLWKRWRLLQGKELYDLATDPLQNTNVIDKFPDVAAKMRAHLDRWWEGVEPRLNEFNPVHLGSVAENPVMLSPCEWADVFLDQGAQIRRGDKKNGVWHVFVERAATYEISLRRWPIEADAAISAGLPPYEAHDGRYAEGIALPIARARLKIADFEDSRAVTPADKAVSFKTKLPAGRTQLQTWFYDQAGKELCGAYYVYVRKL